MMTVAVSQVVVVVVVVAVVVVAVVVVVVIIIIIIVSSSIIPRTPPRFKTMRGAPPKMSPLLSQKPASYTYIYIHI